MKPLIQTSRWQRWLEIVSTSLGGLLFAVVAGGLWALRTGQAADFVELQLAAELKAACNLQLRFSEFEIEPLRAALRISGLSLRDSSGRERLRVQEASADLSMLSLLRGRVQVSEITLKQPKVTVAIEHGQLMGLPTCVTSRKSLRRSRSPLGVSVIEIEDGTVDLSIDTTRASLYGVHATFWPGPVGGSQVTFGLSSGTIITQTLATSEPVLFAEVPIKHLELEGHVEGPLFAPRAIRLDQLQASIGGLQLDAQGRLDFLGLVYTANIQAAGDMSLLPKLHGAWPDMAGQVLMSLSLEGDRSSPRAKTNIEWRNGRIGPRKLGDKLSISAQIDKTGVQFNNLRLFMGGGDMRAKGSLMFDQHLSLNLDCRSRHLSFARSMDALGEEGVWVDFAVNGPTRLKGTLRPISLSGPFDFNVDGVRVWNRRWDLSAAQRVPSVHRQMLDVVPLRISGRWQFTRSEVFIQNARLVSERSRGWGLAKIRHQAPGSVSVKADFGHFSFADLGPVGGTRLTGEGKMSGKIEGLFAKLSGEGKADLSAVSIAGVPLGAASAEVNWDGKKALKLENIKGRLRSSRWHGRVGVRFDEAMPIQVQGRVSRGRLGDLLVPLGLSVAQTEHFGGDVTGSFNLRGPISHWRGPLRFGGTDIEIAGQNFVSGRFDAEMVEGRVEFERAELDAGDGKIQAEGWILPRTKTLDIKVSSEPLTMPKFAFMSEKWPRLGGELRLDSHLFGSMYHPNGYVEVGILRLAAAGLTFGSGRIRADFENQLALLEGHLPEVGTQFTGKFGLRGSREYTASLDLSRAPVPNVVGTLLGVDASGMATLSAQLQGRMSEGFEPDGELRIKQFRVKTGGTKFDLQVPATWQIKAGNILFNDLRLRGRHLHLSATGVAGLHDASVDLQGRLDLSLLPRWISSVEQSGGLLHFNGGFRRRSGGWELVGVGRLDDGLLEWRGFPSRLTGLRGDLTFTQSSLLLEGLSGRWAKGNVHLSGSLSLEKILYPRLDLVLALENARPRWALAWSDLVGRLDGTITIDGSWPRLRARGALDVRQARAIPRTHISQIVGSRPLAAAYDPSVEVIKLDIALPLVDPLRVRNDDVDVVFTGGVRLTGTNERMGLLGSLSLERGGRVTFIGREYFTEGGLIEMRERYRLSTRYDLSVSSKACDATIQLSLTGSLESVSTSYSSNPEMNQSDIVSCLVRGIKDQNLDQDVFSFAGSALLKLSGVDRQVKRVLPLDQIDVTTEFSSRARAYEPRVLVAKDLSLLDRPARLEYSTSLLSSEDQRAAFRIRLTPLLSLQLGWTSSEDVPMGDWGLDLKRSWEW
ncbi:MAG: translocation/assembly module TamB [Myxococcales bacterium]|nr:translocation/assembly module TamB [Myxococcales bacterium]